MFQNVRIVAVIFALVLRSYLGRYSTLNAQVSCDALRKLLFQQVFRIKAADVVETLLRSSLSKVPRHLNARQARQAHWIWRPAALFQNSIFLATLAFSQPWILQRLQATRILTRARLIFVARKAASRSRAKQTQRWPCRIQPAAMAIRPAHLRHQPEPMQPGLKKWAIAPIHKSPRGKPGRDAKAKGFGHQHLLDTRKSGSTRLCPCWGARATDRNIPTGQSSSTSSQPRLHPSFAALAQQQTNKNTHALTCRSNSLGS